MVLLVTHWLLVNLLLAVRARRPTTLRGIGLFMAGVAVAMGLGALARWLDRSSMSPRLDAPVDALLISSLLVLVFSALWPAAYWVAGRKGVRCVVAAFSIVMALALLAVCFGNR